METNKIQLIERDKGIWRKELIEDVEKMIDKRIEHPLYTFDINKKGKKKIYIEISQIIKERILILEELKNQLKELKEKN
jgi:hypothetical protein